MRCREGVQAMTDAELRDLCHRYFDAIERRDVQTVAELYAPEFRFWINLTGAETSREENLKALAEGYALHRRRTYDDRTIHTFETGFVVRYSVNVVEHSGRRTSLSACVVAGCRDGRITRIDEYLDSIHFRAPRRPARQAAR
jgi:ketosteroid isomerase-like protein